MIKKLTKRKNVLTGHVKNLYGNISKNLYGNISGNLSGNISGISGNITGNLYGDISGISGDITGIEGNLNDCGLTPEDRQAGVNINDLLEVEND